MVFHIKDNKTSRFKFPKENMSIEIKFIKTDKIISVYFLRNQKIQDSFFVSVNNEEDFKKFRTEVEHFIESCGNNIFHIEREDDE